MKENGGKWTLGGVLTAFGMGAAAFLTNPNDFCSFLDRKGLALEFLCGKKPSEAKPSIPDLAQSFQMPNLPMFREEESWFNAATKEWQRSRPSDAPRVTAKKLVFVVSSDSEYAPTIKELNERITSSMASSEYVTEFFQKCLDQPDAVRPSPLSTTRELDVCLDRLADIYRQDERKEDLGEPEDASPQAQSSLHLEAITQYNRDGLISVLIVSRRYCPSWDTAPTIFRQSINYNLLLPEGKRFLGRDASSVRMLREKCETWDGVLYFSEKGAGCLAKMEAYNANEQYTPRELYTYHDLRKQLLDPILNFQIDRWMELQTVGN